MDWLQAKIARQCKQHRLQGGGDKEALFNVAFETDNIISIVSAFAVT